MGQRLFQVIFLLINLYLWNETRRRSEFMRSSLKHPKNTSDNPVQFNFKRYKEDHTGT